MFQAVSKREFIDLGERLYLAFELGWSKWKLGFTAGLDERMWEMTIPARDLERLKGAISRARERFGLPSTVRIISCYEAGRDGFWLDRWLRGFGIENRVVDSSSIEVDRRARRAKTDRLDVAKLLSMLVRHECGEKKVWSVVRVPSLGQEDGRHLHRELKTLKRERTRLINRIKGLLASQGVEARMGRRGLLEPLESIRIWDGSPLPEGLRARLRRELKRYEFVHRQVLDLEAESHKALREGKDPAVVSIRQMAHLRGIGLIGSMTLVREFGWRDFRNRRQVGSLCGIAPTPYDSGQSQRERGISRAGNRHVRGVIVDLAWAWLRWQPHSELSLWYQRRFGDGSSRIRRIGIVALARRLLIALWRYWAQGQLPRGATLKPKSI
jgi:transposase